MKVLKFRPKLPDLPIPGPETSFAELQALTRELTESLLSIKSAAQTVPRLSLSAIGPESIAHYGDASRYLHEERLVRQELKEAITSTGSQRITRAANSIRDLDNFVSAVNRAAEQLIAEYSIPEQEAHGLWVS